MVPAVSSGVGDRWGFVAIILLFLLFFIGLHLWPQLSTTSESWTTTTLHTITAKIKTTTVNTATSSLVTTTKAWTTTVGSGCGPAKECGVTSPCTCGINCDGGTVDTRFPPEPCDCKDGTNQNYMWVSDIIITDLDDESFSVGDTVEVTGTIHCFNSETSVALAYNDGMNWVNKHSGHCEGIHPENVTATFPLTGGAGTQKLRVMTSWSGTYAMTCVSSDSYADHDDVYFQVGSSTSSTSSTTTMASYCGPAKTCGQASPCRCGLNCDGGTVHTRSPPQPCDCKDGLNQHWMWVADVTVKDLIDDTFSVGDSVKVTGVIHCYSNETDIAVAYNDGSGWVNTYYGGCEGAGEETVYASFLLTGGAGTHKVRVMESYSGTPAMTCDSQDPHADHDDIEFSVTS